MKDPFDKLTTDIARILMSKPDDKLKTAIVDLADATVTAKGISAYKVTYQFAANNHMLRNNVLVFFTDAPEKARTLATTFLTENNLPWFKILSVQKA